MLSDYIYVKYRGLIKPQRQEVDGWLPGGGGGGEEWGRLLNRKAFLWGVTEMFWNLIEVMAVQRSECPTCH